jgi:RNA ligase (TIGR02306 family)
MVDVYNVMGIVNYKVLIFYDKNYYKEKTFMRKMATIRMIGNISNIPDAENIEKATIDGWEVVVERGRFSSGDMCVYCEIDSILPEKPEFEFLRDRKFRIKTIKLRGQISQGIIFPLSILPEGENIFVGRDVSEVLGVVKYESQLAAQLSGRVKGYFPIFIPKTDEERAQNIPNIIDMMSGTEMYVTQKLDGSSITIYKRDGVIGVCSRNLELKLDDPDNAYVKTVSDYNIDAALVNYDNIALQGELVGPGIQKNRDRFPKTDVFFYNVFWIDTQNFMNFEDFVPFIKDIGLKTVPIIDDNFILNHKVSDLVELSHGKSIFSDHLREGLVFRSKKEMKIDQLGRFSFKAIDPNYLLKVKE